MLCLKEISSGPHFVIRFTLVFSGQFEFYKTLLDFLDKIQKINLKFKLNLLSTKNVSITFLNHVIFKV